MRIALIRREFITHLDGVNKFIANLAEGLKLLGHDVVLLSWSYRGVRGDELSKWFKILTYIYRELGLSLRDSLLGFSVFALMSLTRYHHSAQVYSWATYWLLFLPCAPSNMFSSSHIYSSWIISVRSYHPDGYCHGVYFTYTTAKGYR